MARKFNTVAKFATTENSKKLVNCMEDYANHYIAERLKMQSATYDSKVSLLDKAVKLNEIFTSELERRSKYSLKDFDSVEDYANFPAVAHMASTIQKIMIDTVTPILINATGLNMLAEFHYGGYGDVFQFEDKDNSVYSVSKMGRRQKHTKTQESKKINKTIATDMYGLTVVTNLPKILLGEDMLAEDIMKMNLAMSKKVYTLVIKKFIEATEKITDPVLQVTNYTEKTALKAFKVASAKNGAKVIMVGDAIALKDILPTEARTRILLQDEFNTSLGYMSQWNTYTVTAFDAVSDDAEEDGILGLPEDRVYGIPMNGSKLIHVAIGSTLANTDDEFDNNNLAILSTFRKELGVELATTGKVVKIELQ